MFKPLIRAAWLAAFLLSVPLAAQQPAPITAADMLGHIQILASDRFEGRAPASAGERLTTDYITEQLRTRGLEPAGEGGTWLQPVGLVDRTTRSQEVEFTAGGRRLPFEAGNIALQGRDPDVRTANARVIFAGHGARIPARSIDQLAGIDLHGAIVFILFDAPEIPDFPSFAERVRTVTDGGAAAVIAITGADLEWRFVIENYRRPSTKLSSQTVAPIVGAMPLSAAQTLFTAAGADLGRLLNDRPGSAFRAVAVPLQASLHVVTDVRNYATNNVVGRIRGSGATGENVMFLAHWDHLGLCRPDGAADRICNGAVDNASGIAMMIEVAGRLASAPRPARDIIILATTAEEEGLLGAEYFATHPLVPLESIVAAINLDTVAVAPAGEPVAILNRGIPGLDALVESTATAMGRRMDRAHEADVMTERQDGWALARRGVPAIMVGGSFASMARLNAFLQGRYHQPNDQADGGIEMGGATEDANLLVALGRRLADPAAYTRPQRTAE
jgi:Zn-dependent M28 family amino/carboxypeptidase